MKRTRQAILSLMAIVGAMAMLTTVRAQDEDAPKVPVSGPPPTAQAVMAKETGEAREGHKTVFLVFHASWCGWCKKLESALRDPANRKIIRDNYEMAYLDVQEHDAAKKAALENPGGMALLQKYGGEHSGLPFYVFLDLNGKKLADSNVMPKHENIGYPGAPDEIAAFAALLRKTAPRMTDAQRAQIVAYLTKNAPKPSGQAASR